MKQDIGEFVLICIKYLNAQNPGFRFIKSIAGAGNECLKALKMHANGYTL